MTAQEQNILYLYNLLPQAEQTLAFELLKRLVLAWDSDYSKLTPAERVRLEESELDLARGDVADMKDIDWN